MLTDHTQQSCCAPPLFTDILLCLEHCMLHCAAQEAWGGGVANFLTKLITLELYSVRNTLLVW